ncbi:transposase [Stenotrophomonas rhizophila]|jgi:REP element-mobilizing transposase RayT|nr:transposase [Stenotrophomonas rhizophila]
MLTSTVADRRKLFVDAARVECVVEALRCSDREARSRTLAWVVMPDHVHWLMQLRDGNISRCMQAFKSRASRAFNLHTGAQGSVWQRGFYDHCVRSDESLERQARYLIENPVRAGLAASVGEYPYLWSRWPMTPETSPAEDSQPR